MSKLFAQAMALLAGSLFLVGCDQRPDAATVTRYASTALPADTELAEIYQRSCQACHGQGSSAAPLTGDEAAWRPRLAQGMDTLIEHVVAGFGGMPPYGLCMDCNVDDFEQLIHFMSRYPGSPEPELP